MRAEKERKRKFKEEEPTQKFEMEGMGWAGKRGAGKRGAGKRGAGKRGASKGGAYCLLQPSIYIFMK